MGLRERGLSVPYLLQREKTAVTGCNSGLLRDPVHCKHSGTTLVPAPLRVCHRHALHRSVWNTFICS